jgi:primosomal protein N' (replication factor Y)
VLGPVEVDPDAMGRGPGGRGSGVPSGGRPGGAAGRGTAVQALDLPVRTVLRVPLAQGEELARRLKASLAVRSARREGGVVRVQLDPKEML